jgi:hypothetical protein
LFLPNVATIDVYGCQSGGWPIDLIVGGATMSPGD